MCLAVLLADQWWFQLTLAGVALVGTFLAVWLGAQLALHHERQQGEQRNRRALIVAMTTASRHLHWTQNSTDLPRLAEALRPFIFMMDATYGLQHELAYVVRVAMVQCDELLVQAESLAFNEGDLHAFLATERHLLLQRFVLDVAKCVEAADKGEPYTLPVIQLDLYRLPDALTP